MKRYINHFIIMLSVIVLTGLISSKYFFRIDLTSEKRYTLSSETKQILRQLDAPLYVDVFLEGDLHVQFRKLRNSIREMLDDFKTYSGNRIVYNFIDPSDADNAQEREENFAILEEEGIRRITVGKTNKDGSQSAQIIFPGAIFYYKNRIASVNLLSTNQSIHWEMRLNASFESLQYELIKTVNMVSADSIGHIAFIHGHGELNRAETFDLGTEFANYYEVERKAINGQLNALDPYKAIIIAKPREAFDEKDKFVIDRYIMRGGKVIWLIDGAHVNTDSLYTQSMTFALHQELNLEDQLFNYGVRINPSVVQDIVANQIGITLTDGSSQPTLAPWLYYPLVEPSPRHPITRNLDLVWLRYPGYIDTLGRNSEVRKSVLLQTSPMSRVRGLPSMISLNEVQRPTERQHFNNQNLITAVLLEGQFPSVFRNRNAQIMFPELQEQQAPKSIETKMIIVADGDIARNDVRNTQQGQVPSPNPLGFDRNSHLTFGNKEFLVNSLNYLTDDAGLMNLRNREFKLRLLNKQKVAEELFKWQIINLVLPMFLLLAGGLAYNRWRRYRYG